MNLELYLTTSSSEREISRVVSRDFGIIIYHISSLPYCSWALQFFCLFTTRVHESNVPYRWHTGDILVRRGALSIHKNSGLKFRKFHNNQFSRAQWNGTFSSSTDFLQAGYKRAVLGATILSDGKRHFGPTTEMTRPVKVIFQPEFSVWSLVCLVNIKRGDQYKNYKVTACTVFIRLTALGAY